MSVNRLRLSANPLKHKNQGRKSQFSDVENSSQDSDNDYYEPKDEIESNKLPSSKDMKRLLTSNCSTTSSSSPI